MGQRGSHYSSKVICHGRTIFLCILLLGLYCLRPSVRVKPKDEEESQNLPEEAKIRQIQTVRTEPSLASLYDELRIVEKSIEMVIEKKNSKRKRVIIFTMDSTLEYKSKASRGGASGEITIRRSLEMALDDMGAEVQVLTSDSEFASVCCAGAALIILDPWTWAAPGWIPKPQLRGHEDKIFLLDFFGSQSPRNNGIKIPPSHILTAYPTVPDNTFLGYAFEDQAAFTEFRPSLLKKNQVVLWGKDPKHFAGRIPILQKLASVVQLHSTLPTGTLKGVPNLIYHGHLNKVQWHQLLAESKAVIGMGHPLLGPTALDAIAHGTVYIDPSYAPNTKGLKYPQYRSQHPYLRDYATKNPQLSSYVCPAKLDDPDSFVSCVQTAIRRTPDLQPHIPPDFRRDKHRARVRAIFGSVLLSPSTSSSIDLSGRSNRRRRLLWRRRRSRRRRK